MSDRPTYIYALCEPGTEVTAGELPPPDRVRYVGKTIEPEKRYRAHINLFGRTHRLNWIRKCVRAGTPPVMAVIEIVPVGADWQEAERRWIAHYKVLGADLTNGTIGGDGVIDPTGEIRDKMIASAKKTWSAPERRAGLSARAKARWQDPEYRAKVLDNRDPAVLLAAMSNPEVRAKLSASHKAMWADPKKRAARLANLSGDGTRQAWADPEKRAVRIVKLKEAWADPERRAARIAAGKAGKARKHLERLAAAAVGEQLSFLLGGKPVGVSRCAREGGWRARIDYHGKTIYLGRFLTWEEAGRAYDAKARELFGDDAILNFPLD